ncbi:sulfotransferase family 2 domain-containing protein [Oceanicella sp. SM1341]|uniref:sulfotransferase family 2 domain-containing protein n=1 Tax=Oceanicella sp. SM1341 TaxID=1548889 RepID=UPI000E4F2487|nr:sulfotransferase family 2 domain-containing protein [Oceanicella sp. SM1341]
MSLGQPSDSGGRPLTFADFRPGRVRDYIEAMRASGMWVFQHIPKTAGSSLSAELARHRGPYRNIHIAYMDRGSSLTDRRDAATQQFLDDLGSEQLRSASGHLRFENVESIREAIPDVHLFTFVRDPVERVISEYHYSRSPEHADPEGFMKRFPTLGDFARSSEATNKMAVFIAGRRRIAPAHLPQYAFERFHFIGSQKLYTLSYRLLSTMLWHPTKQKAALRVSGRKNAADDVDPEILEIIRDNNRADQALFNAVQVAYREVRDELNEVLKEYAEEWRAKNPRADADTVSTAD